MGANFRVKVAKLLVYWMFDIELTPYVEDLLRTPTDAIHCSSRQRKRNRVRRSAAYDEQLVKDGLIRRVMGCVEAGLKTGDHQLREAILVSFIEALAKHERSGTLGKREVARLREHFGPNLRAGWESLQRWLDQPFRHDKNAEYQSIQWEPV